MAFPSIAKIMTVIVIFHFSIASTVPFSEWWGAAKERTQKKKKKTTTTTGGRDLLAVATHFSAHVRFVTCHKYFIVGVKPLIETSENSDLCSADICPNVSETVKLN